MPQPAVMEESPIGHPISEQLPKPAEQHTAVRPLPLSCLKRSGHQWPGCRAPILTISTSEDESDSDADTREPPRKRRPLQSGQVHSADAMVVKKLTWPHELVYTAVGQPAVYEDLPVALFVNGYLTVMETIKPDLKPIMGKHLRELIADAKVYS